MAYYFSNKVNVDLRWKKKLVYITEKDCLDHQGQSETGEFLPSKSERMMLIGTIKSLLKPTKSFNYDVSSYSLKHILEAFLGYYISNSDVKAAMVACGFKVENINQLNWYFNVSKASINSLRTDTENCFGHYLNEYINNVLIDKTTYRKLEKCCKETIRENHTYLINELDNENPTQIICPICGAKLRYGVALTIIKNN